MPPAVPSDPLRAFSRSLPMALLRARESLMARFRPMLRAHGLTEQRWRVLRAMAAAEQKLRPTELGQMTCLNLPSLSRLIRSLEDAGLLRQNRHADDLRVTELTLTPAGRALVRQVAPHSERIYSEIEKLVGSKEVEMIYALCDRVADRLGAGPPDELDEA